MLSLNHNTSNYNIVRIKYIIQGYELFIVRLYHPLPGNWHRDDPSIRDGSLGRPNQ